MAFSTFDEARMQALKDYADLEYELCRLLHAILCAEAAVASAIFYQVSNTRARYAIIHSLLDIRHSDTFKKAWPKIEQWLQPCDTARNHIIHWGQDIRTTVNVIPGLSGEVDQDAEVTVAIDLMLSNNVRKWRGSEAATLTYSEEGIRDESFKIRVMKHVVNRFSLSIYDPDRWPWTDIFQQPVSDRTPAEFLQRLNDRGHPVLA